MKSRLIIMLALICYHLGSPVLAQEIITAGAAEYESSNLVLTLTPDSLNKVGGAYAKYLDGSILAINLNEGFVLETANVYFGNKDTNGGHGFVIFLTTDSVFHTPSDFIPTGTGDTLGYQLGLSKAIGFEFDTHIAQDSAFHDYSTEDDHLALISEDITAPPLFGPVSLLHKREEQDTITNVEAGSEINIEITWDPEEQLIEIYANDALRMSYNINLVEYFNDSLIAYPGVVGATGSVSNEQILTLSDRGWLVKEDPRPINSCADVRNLTNWLITNNPDNAFWNMSPSNGDNVVQEDNGLPSFLASPIELIDVRMEGTVRVLNDAPDDDWIGIGWGMSTPFGQVHDIYDGFFLDFKKVDQLWCNDTIPTNEGFTLAKLNGFIDPECSSFIDHDSTSAFQLIDQQYGDEEGWETGKEYVFTVDYTGHYFETWVTEEGGGDTLYHYFHENNEDNLFKPGRFAFYNNSQVGIVCTNFDYKYLHRFKASNYNPFTNEPVTFTYDFPFSDLPKTINDLQYKIGDSTIVDALNEDTIISVQHTFTLPGTYPVSLCLIDAAGCEHIFTDTLAVREEPFFNLPEDTVLCPGEVLLLSTPYTGAEIIWQDSIEFPSLVVSESGEYWVSIRDGEYIQHDTITVRYADTIKYTLDIQTSCYQQNNGQVSVQILQATPPYEVMLDEDRGTFHSNLPPGTHHLMITDKYGCIAEQALEVPESCAPEYDVQIDSTSCWGADDGLISGSDKGCPLKFSLNEETFESIAWFDELESGTYTVTAIDSIGCQWDTTLTVPTPPPFTASVIPDDTTIYLGASAPLRIQLNYVDSAQVTWMPPASLSCGSCLQTLASPQKDQVYDIDVINSKGCETSITAQVKINHDKRLYWPNAFSPDGDGMNEDFYPEAGEKRKGIKEIIELCIFDRGGSLVFQNENFFPDNPLSGWDGTFNGKKAAIGVYAVQAKWEYIDGHTGCYRGDLTLIR